MAKAKEQSSDLEVGGDALWRERQQATRKKASWPWTLGLCAVAACYAGYTRLEWQSRQHPLQMRVLHVAQQGDATSAPLMQIELPDAPASGGDTQVEGPHWEAKVKKAAFLAPGAKEWHSSDLQVDDRASKYLQGQPTSRREGKGTSEGSGSVRATWPRNRGWLPEGDHKLEVEVEGYLVDGAENTWSASKTLSLHVVVPTPTMPPPTKAIEGIARLQYAPGLVTSRPSKNASGAQVSEALWRDLPAPGEPGFPLTAPSSGFVSFRAVQKGRAPGDSASFAPLNPRWKEASRDSDFWSPSFDYAYLPNRNGLPPGGEYKRIEVLVEAQENEVVRGVAPAKVKAGQKSGAVGWVLVRPENDSGAPAPPFDEDAAQSAS